MGEGKEERRKEGVEGGLGWEQLLCRTYPPTCAHKHTYTHTHPTCRPRSLEERESGGGGEGEEQRRRLSLPRAQAL